MLASYGARILPRERVQEWAQLGRKSTSEGQFHIAVWVSWDAVFTNDLFLWDLNAAFQSGLEYIGCGLLAEQIRESSQIQDPINFYGDFQNWRQQLTQGSLDKLPNHFSIGVIQPILMTLCSMESSPSIDLLSWRQALVNILGENEVIDILLEWIEIGIGVTDGVEEAVRKVREFDFTASGIKEEEIRMVQLLIAGSPSLPIRENLSAQASFLLMLFQNRHFFTYEFSFTRMVAKRWIHLAKKQNFLLTTPRLYSSQILDAASSDVPTLQEVATLLLLVGNAIGVSWSDNSLAQLRQISTQLN